MCWEGGAINYNTQTDCENTIYVSLVAWFTTKKSDIQKVSYHSYVLPRNNGQCVADAVTRVIHVLKLHLQRQTLGLILKADISKCMIPINDIPVYNWE